MPSSSISPSPGFRRTRESPPGPDGRTLIEATVADTRELRWWLRGFGDHVEVQSPAALRSEFKEQSRALHELYESGE